MARRSVRIELQSKLSDREAEVERLVREYQVLQASVAERAAEPKAEASDKALSKALEAKDLDAALELKLKEVEKQSERQKEETTKLARDKGELGKIYELRFEWEKALEAYREAGSWSGVLERGSFMQILHRNSFGIRMRSVPMRRFLRSLPVRLIEH